MHTGHVTPLPIIFQLRRFHLKSQPKRHAQNFVPNRNIYSLVPRLYLVTGDSLGMRLMKPYNVHSTLTIHSVETTGWQRTIFHLVQHLDDLACLKADLPGSLCFIEVDGLVILSINLWDMKPLGCGYRTVRLALS